MLLIKTFAGFRSRWIILAECKYLRLNKLNKLPTHYLIGNKPDMLNFKEVAISFKYLTQITITVLCDNIQLGKIVNILIFGNDDINHLHNIGMLTIL